MNIFLSNDRKVILKSAAAGVGIISLLSLVLLTESMILWGLAFFGVLAVYWCIPTWFSRARQLEKKETKYFTPDGIEVYGPTIPQYKYFNAEGEEVRKLSNKEKLTFFILFIVISVVLVLFAYDTPVKFLLTHYQSAKIIILGAAAVISFSTPYLIRHIYCFYLDLPMDTSFELNGNGTTYIHQYGDSRAHNQYTHRYDSNRSFATNPVYSSLSCNIYNHRR